MSQPNRKEEVVPVKKFNAYCLYHEKEAPEGLIIKNEEMEKKLGQGWVDTPAKFGKKPLPKTK